MPVTAAALIAAFGFGLAAAAQSPKEAAHANRLVDSANPYLLLHAHNPVDWYPWGSEAFDTAKRERKPIFLSVGYSTCYWCHVAEKTIYSDPAIAALMNEWFVNIKVDREERPDVDATYMLATQLITGHGGWPNNVFLTPDQRPFFAGSYFPPTDDAFGRSGFTTILKAIHQQWTARPQKIIDQGDIVFEAMKRARETPSIASAASIDLRGWMNQARSRLAGAEDRDHGGLGGRGPKFPQEPILGFLLADFRSTGNRDALAQLSRSLDAMAFGGIHDHVGGGFHRYTVEPTWSIPHFEKMLYNNAQLLNLYAQAYEATKDPLYRDVANDIARYLARRMKSREGGFFTAEDAEADGEEGQSYLWSRKEIEAALGNADTKRLFEVYRIEPIVHSGAAEMKSEGERGVIRVRLPLPERLLTSRTALAEAVAKLEPQRAKLLAVRDRRPQPARDDKIVAGLNGLAIDALAKASRALGKTEYLEWARAAGEHLWNTAHDEKSGSLKHQVFHGQARIEAYLDDYALLGLGYLALSDVTGETLWRDHAETLADALLERFGRADGSLATTADTGLLLAGDDEGDNTIPAGTSAALALLFRLAAAHPRFAAPGDKLLLRTSARVQAGPEQWSYFVVAANTLGPATSSTVANRALTVLDTAAHVRATGKVVAAGDREELIVTLVIERGYHVNANPASLENLIPTTLKIPEVADVRISYPASVRFKPAFAAEAISVYEGAVRIAASASKGKLKEARPVVRAQACDDQVCLPPADVAVAVKPQVP